MKKTIPLDSILTDQGTQTRSKLNEDIVAEYSEAMANGSQFPELVVFHDGSQYFLADGFHRFFAAATAGLKELPCEIRKGTRLDALRFALGANTTNGLRRTNADKLNCIRIALKEFPALSSSAIAVMCAVSHTFVDQHRPTQPATVASCEVREGKDGKKRKLPKRTETKPEEPEAPRIKTAEEILAAESSKPATSAATTPETEQAASNLTENNSFASGVEPNEQTRFDDTWSTILIWLNTCRDTCPNEKQLLAQRMEQYIQTNLI